MSTALLIDSLVRTIQVGSLYALMAVGLTLTLAVIRLPNFAHAELITVGAYAALVTSLWLSSNPIIVCATALVVAALVEAHALDRRRGGGGGDPVPGAPVRARAGGDRAGEAAADYRAHGRGG